MDLGTLASRKQTALQNIVESAGLLADSFLPDKSLVRALENAKSKDKEVAALFQLEAIAELLRAINDETLLFMEGDSWEAIAERVLHPDTGVPNLSKTAREAIERWARGTHQPE